MSRSALVRDSLFDESSQWMNFDPGDVRLIHDRVLIEDLPEADKIGSIFLPEVCQDKEIIRQGLVIAVGPGDSCIEIVDKYRLESDGRPVVRRISYKTEDGHVPLTVKPGDRVLYSRRREAEVYLKGRRYAMVYESQSIFAVLESN